MAEHLKSNKFNYEISVLPTFSISHLLNRKIKKICLGGYEITKKKNKRNLEINVN